MADSTRPDVCGRNMRGCTASCSFNLRGCNASSRLRGWANAGTERFSK